MEQVISLPYIETMKQAVLNHYADELYRLNARYYGDRFSESVYGSAIQEMEEAIAELLVIDENDTSAIYQLEMKYRAVINELADLAQV